jgi:hypothetical protein
MPEGNPDVTLTTLHDATDVKALIARIDVLIRGRDDGEPTT